MDQSWLGENDGINDRWLDLAREEQCYRTVVVLIIGIMMDEFMQLGQTTRTVAHWSIAAKNRETICVPTEALEFSRAPGWSAFRFRSIGRLNGP